MSKTTYDTSQPATFNLSLLYHNLAYLQNTDPTLYASINRFLTHNDIHDTRISADDNNCKGMCLTVMSTGYQHVLFDSINYKKIFNLSKYENTDNVKLAIYNKTMGAFNMITHEGNVDCIVNDASEYVDKVKLYIPKAIRRCMDSYTYNNPYNSKQEGVYKFWKTVDAIIFDEKAKRDLNHLKAFRGNT